MAPPVDPYAQLAQKPPADPYAALAGNSAPEPPQSLGEQVGDYARSTALPALGHLALGAGQGLMSTATALPRMAARGIERFENPEQRAVTESRIAEQERLNTPTTTGAKIGKGIEQAGEFMVPGGAEKSLVMRAPEAVRPLARIGASALSSGAVNKLQGGGFGTGALAGGIGAGTGEVLRAAAPKLAESAMQLPKKMRGFGKTTGKAILEDTTGVRPESVGESAAKRIGELYNDLEQRASAVSEKPNPVKGLLAPPPRIINLAEPWIPDTPGEVIPAAHLPQGNITGMGHPEAEGRFYSVGPGGRTQGVPGRNVAEIGSTANTVPARLQRESYVTKGTREPTDLPRSGPGVLIRPGETQEGPIRPTIANPVASLGPARASLSAAAGRVPENYPTLGRQIGAMQENLQSGSRGEIPENVTPLRLLGLKQGFSGEHLRWNPDLHEQAQRAGRQAYHALDEELDRTVPGAQAINQRISSLIPAKIRGESLSRDNPFLNRMGQRIAARTGALTLGTGLGYEGYKEHGIKGAAAGFLAGVAAPELIADPTGQMIIARTLNRSGALRPVVGGALQLTRGGNNQ